MCILFIFRNPDADNNSYKFIIASNRDEYYSRPAKEAHRWLNTDPECIGGTDMEPGREGGTWLAAALNGRLGVILNLSRESSEPKKGRGFLIWDYISSLKPTATFLNELHHVNQELQPYNPYNLVVADMKNADVFYLGSYKDAPEPYYCGDNILGFGNSPLSRPYKKVTVGKEKFKEIVDNASTKHKDQLVKNLLQFLKNPEKHLPDEELVKRSPTNYTDLSSICVTHAGGEYGTRTHTIVLVDNNNQLTFIEETLMPDQKWHCQSFEAALN